MPLEEIRHTFGGGWATAFGPTTEVDVRGGRVVVPYLVDADNIEYTLWPLLAFAHYYIQHGEGEFFRPYTRVGAGFSKEDIKLTAGANAGASDTNWIFTWQVGAGTEFALSPILSLDLEFLYTQVLSKDKKYNFDGTSLRVPFSTNWISLLAGLKLYFG